eukprot:CAMPEP_0202345924 /NCGR_PEP_ID=MMETSP1126-20121109/4943_1 /ASSEMBLY_ACC=CAM_ASM_000457 /TAXON_ID=3047 /ORGANISM="Dunaliella tertiolecta, Strain CCMP1320" /LENGTH=681 /DNA_ID=CAMNT_0048937275 /DNA_START=53 /DNA_END=2098 /DNA_ORIENTATION=+
MPVLRAQLASTSLAASTSSTTRSAVSRPSVLRQQRNVLSSSCQRRGAVLPKAAAEDTTLENFSLSDAKRANDYSTADVQQALAYYVDGEGSAPSYDSDFVTNNLGLEDASFFDDIDNNEAYAADEYVVAGIPEAAPKKRRAERPGRGGSQEEGDDNLEQAKSIDRMREMEERMVMEADNEENFGDAAENQLAPTSTGKLAMWDWLMEANGAELDSTQLEDARLATKKRSNAAQISDKEVASELNAANPDIFEDPDVREYLELFASDDLSEETLKLIGSTDEAEDLPDSTLQDADMARIDSVLAQEVPRLSAEQLTLKRGPAIKQLDENEPSLDKEVVDKYLASLRSAVDSKSEVSEADVKAMFGDEAQLEPEGAAGPDESAEVSKLLSFPDAAPEAQNVDVEALASSIINDEGEPTEEDDHGYTSELRELASIDDFNPEEMPSEEQLELIDQYMTSAEDYMAAEEARKADIAEKVAAGLLPPDVLAEDLEMLPDAVDEIIGDEEFEEDIEMAAAEEEDDGEQWLERIIELSRVTKVVKGGKIMGFRCVAIVGNSNGLVGVGCMAGREVAMAVKRTLLDAKRNVIRVPLVGPATIPHFVEAKYHGARCVVRPASDGTGCIAGGSVRSVLELAGVKNCLAKRIGSRSALNSARATIRGLQQLQSLHEAAAARGVPFESLLLPQ